MANETAGNLVARLRWAGKQVRIEEVDAILSALWSMSADNLRTPANIQVRTSVLNLVICTPDVTSARYASALLRNLASAHLARATIVILDTSQHAPDLLETWVTLRCFPMISDLTRHCFEQATLLTSGQASRNLRSTLPRVLKSHLPTYLWWVGDIIGNDDTIFHHVVEQCQRVIVDSATFLQPEQDIHALSTYCKHTPQMALSDLTWGRLTPWRQLIAQFFDMPEHLPFLNGIERIEIEHSAAPLAEQYVSENGAVSPNPAAALLLAGWLVARLHLTLAPNANPQRIHETHSGTYRWLLSVPANNASTVMQIQPYIQSRLQPGSLHLIRLTCTNGNKRAVFTIKREANSDAVLTSVETTQGTCLTRTVNLPVRYNESELLYNELEIMGHDPVFEQTLQEVDILLAQQ